MVDVGVAPSPEDERGDRRPITSRSLELSSRGRTHRPTLATYVATVSVEREEQGVPDTREDPCGSAFEAIPERR
jgi:hypothetical protein